VRDIEIIEPNNFELDHHFYPKALNSELHPIVNHFFNLQKERIIKRYLHLNPQVHEKTLSEVLSYQPNTSIGEDQIFFM
jgi:hypothetical protein